MKAILPLLLLFAFSQSVASDSLGTRKELVYYCLDLEKQAGFEVTDQAYLMLDSILYLAEKRINPKDTLAKNYPVNILQEVHTILEELGIEGDYNQEDPYKSLLSYSLQTKKFDCDNYSFTFLAIAQRLHLPIHAVLLPSHMAIEWTDHKRHFYWETTDQSERSKEDYIIQFSLNKYHFNQQMYLTKMSKENLVSCFLYNRGLTFLMLEKYKEAEKDLDSASSLKGIYPYLYQMKYVCRNKIAINRADQLLLLRPDNINARIQRAKANILLKTHGDYTKAFNDLNYVISMQPSVSEAHLWRGVAYLHQFIAGRLTKGNKKYKKALKDFDFVLSTNRSSHEALFYRSILNRWARDYESAMNDIDAALSINSTDTTLIEKGNIYFNQKDFEKAIEYYNRALEINPNCFYAIECRGFAKLELEKRDEAAEDFFKAYYHGIMPYESFQKYVMIRSDD